MPRIRGNTSNSSIINATVVKMSYENQAKYMKIPLDNEMDFELVDDDSADEFNNDDEKLIVPDLNTLLSNLQLAPAS